MSTLYEKFIPYFRVKFYCVYYIEEEYIWTDISNEWGFSRLFRSDVFQQDVMRGTFFDPHFGMNIIMD